MREVIIPGIIEQLDAISPEVRRAQTLAEFEQLSKYRRRQIELYKLWSKDTDKAREIILQRAKDTGEMIEKNLKEKLDINPDYLKYEFKAFKDQVAIRPAKPEFKPIQPTVKKSLFKEAVLWIRSFLS